MAEVSAQLRTRENDTRKALEDRKRTKQELLGFLSEAKLRVDEVQRAILKADQEIRQLDEEASRIRRHIVEVQSSEKKIGMLRRDYAI